jgi:hypothetical protein
MTELIKNRDFTLSTHKEAYKFENLTKVRISVEENVPTYIVKYLMISDNFVKSDELV